MSVFKKIGPAALVTAAFIGPGTVTLCTIAGIQFGYSLLWALLFSVLATIVLQEMAARLGIVTGHGLAALIRENYSNPSIRFCLIGLVLSAIIIGNLAYEAGNISGAVLGLKLFIPHSTITINSLRLDLLPLLISALGFLILFRGNYRTLEKVLIATVVLMSLSFIISALLTKPSITAILYGLFIPGIESSNILTIVGLIGTTVVPYNIFLHSALSNKKWNNPDQLNNARFDTFLAVTVGGLISISIVICAAGVSQSDINSIADLATGVEPLFGSFAKYLLGFGIIAAGISSAVTAPLAAALVAKECFGWPEETQSLAFRMVWISILIPGGLFSAVGFKPIEVIKFAQLVNGMLLPIACGILIWLINKQSIMGSHINTNFQNILSVLILLITIILGGLSISKVIGLV